MMRCVVRLCFVIVTVSLLIGCGGYQLQGRVIEGANSMVLVVGENDPRLTEQGQGIGNVTVGAMIDPRSLNRKAVPSTVSQYTGVFSMPIDEPGAGFLEYEVEVSARLGGHAPAIAQFPLPRSNQRVLVIMSLGRDVPAPQNLLGETLEMGKPYLQDHHD